MLTKTFYHFPGSSVLLEKSLWKQGCKDWFDFLLRPDRFQLGSLDYKAWLNPIQQSLQAYHEKDALYFDRVLGPHQAWRAWKDYRDSCVYLDIETNGSRGPGAVTVVGLYDGADFKCLIRDKDLHHLQELLSKYQMVVTFHGYGFDIPVLKNEFSGIVFPPIHLDLCPTLRQIGLKGGLKKIEEQLGLNRSQDTTGLTGYDAVRLWRSYLYSGNQRALDTLVAYNKEDVVNLEVLAEYAYEQLSKRCRE